MAKALKVEDSVLDDEPRMRVMLVDELKVFQSYLEESKETQPFLLLGDKPTGADLYAQLERLVGGVTASDVPISPALKDLKDNGSGLERLWEWHDMMQEEYPAQFKGKIPPRSML